MAGVSFADFRPDGGEALKIDAGQRQELKRGAAAAVAIDLKPVAAGFGRGERPAPQQR